MAYKVIILYRLYMPSYFLGTFTEYPYLIKPTSLLMFRRVTVLDSLRCGKISPDSNDLQY